MNNIQTDFSSGLLSKTIDPDSVYSPLHSLANKFSTLPSSSSSSNIDSDYQSPAFDAPSGYNTLDMFAVSPVPNDYVDGHSHSDENDDDDDEAEGARENEEPGNSRVRQRKTDAYTDEEDDYQRRFTIGSVKVHTPSICENGNGAGLRDSYFDGSDPQAARYVHPQEPFFSHPSQERGGQERREGQNDDEEGEEDDDDEDVTMTRRSSIMPPPTVLGPRLRKFDESPPWETDDFLSSSTHAPLGPLGPSLIMNRMNTPRSPSSLESDFSPSSKKMANMTIKTTPRSLGAATPDGAAYPSPSSPASSLETLPSGKRDKEKTKTKGGIGGLWKGFGGRIRGKKGEETNTDGLGFDFNSTSTSDSRGNGVQPVEGEGQEEVSTRQSQEDTRPEQNASETSNIKQTLLLSPLTFKPTLRSPLSPSSPLAATQFTHNLPLPSPAFSTSGPPSPSSPNRRPSGLYSPSGPVAGPFALASRGAPPSPGANFRTGLEANLGPNGCPIGTLEGGFKLIPLDEALKRKNALNQVGSRDSLREDRLNRTGSVGGSLRKFFGGNAKGEADKEDTEAGPSIVEGETESRGLTSSPSTGSFSRASFSFISSPVRREILRVNKLDDDDAGWYQSSPTKGEDTPRLLGSPKLKTTRSMNSFIKEDLEDDDHREQEGDGWIEVRRLKIELAKERAAWKKKTADYQNQIQTLQRLLKEATEPSSPNIPLTPV